MSLIQGGESKNTFLEELLPNPVYSYSSKIKKDRMPWIISLIAAIPFFIYSCLHNLAGMILFQGRMCGDIERLDQRRRWILNRISQNGNNLTAERIIIEVNGSKIDALKVHNKKAEKGRYTVIHGGNGQHYENSVDAFTDLIEKAQSHGIFYNYPGFGRSEIFQPWQRQTLYQKQVQDAATAIFSYLDKKLQATQVISLGYSMGGAVQASVDATVLSSKIKYLWISSHTFSTLHKIATQFVGKFASILYLIGWNYNTAQIVASSPHPQLILQYGRQQTIFKDGVIGPAASLAQGLKKYESSNNSNRTIQIVADDHHQRSEGVDNIIVRFIEKHLGEKTSIKIS